MLFRFSQRDPENEEERVGEKPQNFGKRKPREGGWGISSKKPEESYIKKKSGLSKVKGKQVGSQRRGLLR